MGKYIDKGNLCVTRARRFGKSVAVKMLNAYYDRSCHSRELPSGKGFADIVLLPLRGVDAPAILLELKWNQSADTAIAQIKRQEYAGALSGFSGEILLVGVNYSKKTKRHECRIERWEKTQGAAGENSSSNTENSRSKRENSRSIKEEKIVGFCSETDSPTSPTQQYVARED